MEPESILHYTPRTRPYGHQRAALMSAWDRDAYGWLMEMGCGKSKVAVDNICMLRESGGLRRALIVAPKGTYANWARKEIPTHMPERHAMTTITHLWEGGGSAAEQRALARTLADGPELRILVMNIEAISASQRALDTAQRFVRAGDCMVIVDESSTIKNPQAIRTKKLIAIGRLARWRRIATGTPVTRSPLDLWGQFEFLAPACLGHRSFFSFRARYAVTERKQFGGRSIDVVVGHRDTDQLSQVVARHASVVRKEDALDLPPKVFETRDVPLTAEQQRLYSEIRDWATAEIDAGRFATATEVITQLLRMHQIVCGHITDEQGGVSDVPTNRLDVLSELVEEIGDKTIIWCSYRRDVEKVVKKLTDDGLRVVRYDGDTTSDQRREAIFRFQGDEMGRVCPEHAQADVFVGTPHAGGYGITLTAARAVVYYSNSYDLEKRLQSEDRAHRIGQTRSVLYVDLVARGTVDEKIMEALRKKQVLANLIMDGPARIRELLG